MSLAIKRNKTNPLFRFTQLTCKDFRRVAICNSSGSSSSWRDARARSCNNTSVTATTLAPHRFCFVVGETRKELQMLQPTGEWRDDPTTNRHQRQRQENITKGMQIQRRNNGICSNGTSSREETTSTRITRKLAHVMIILYMHYKHIHVRTQGIERALCFR